MSRMKWFGRSLLHLILLLLAVSLVSFLLVSMSPVDPLQTNVGQTALGSMAPEQIEKLQAYWGVGVPVWKRFFSWISGICHGDFGISLLYRRPVLEVIAEKASASVWLLLSAWLFSGIVGIFLGIAAAAKRGKWVDRLITGYCIVIAGTPSFWLALVLAASLYSAASHLPNRVQCPGGNGGGRGQPGGSPVSRISAGVYAGTDRDFFDCDAHARKSD